MTLAARLAAVRAEVGAAARRAGGTPRASASSRCTKTLAARRRCARRSRRGLATSARTTCRRRAPSATRSAPGGTWHLIGGLQRNKARVAVATFDHVQTVDSSAVARALAEEAASRAGGGCPCRSR
jgi:uncharacterized pyridoxal phosphate-containing UPF0001 family protein